MRSAPLVLLLALAGCPLSGRSGECEFDQDCDGDNVCGRDSLCHLPSDVRAVRTIWTIAGQAANNTTCATTPQLYISFLSANDGDNLAYSPVPCFAGQFSMDKLPTRFTRVELGVDDGSGHDFADIDSDGVAAFDLTF